MAAIPETYHKLVLKRRPGEFFTPEDTDIIVDRTPELAAGQALMRTQILAMDPVTRMIIERDLVVVPPINIGDPLKSFVGGVVIASRNEAMPVGTLVCGFLDWSEIQTVELGLRTLVLPQGVPLEDGLNMLGHTAMAAYFGMFDYGKPQAGDTVVVSGAAGAVGSVAGQLAKSAGARVIGIARGADKCRFLIDDLGFDAAIDYTSEDIPSRLDQLAPNGVNVFFDIVGGKLLDDVFTRLAKGARIVVCGAISQYMSDNPMPVLKSEAELAAKDASMFKFNTMENAARFPDAARHMDALRTQGKLVFPQTIVEGFENAPEAFNMLYSGKSRGRVLVKI